VTVEVDRPRWHLRIDGAVSLRSWPSWLEAYRAALSLLADGYELELIDEQALAEHRRGVVIGPD
jgi:hypothetical protein